MRPSSAKWMWVSLLLTLIVGIAMGVAIDRLAIERAGRDGDRRDRGARLVSRLASELDLTPEQRAKVEAVLASSRERARALWRESQAAHEAFRSEVREDIRSLLDPHQQARFDEMIRRDDERRRRREERR